MTLPQPPRKTLSLKLRIASSPSGHTNSRLKHRNAEEGEKVLKLVVAQPASVAVAAGQQASGSSGKVVWKFGSTQNANPTANGEVNTHDTAP